MECDLRSYHSYPSALRRELTETRVLNRIRTEGDAVYTFINLFQKIRNRTGVLAALNNIGWLSSDRAVRLFGGVVVSVTVARYLGPSQFGLLNYGLAIFSLFNIVSNLGLDFLVVREVAVNEDCEPQILGTAFFMKAAASVITTLAAIMATMIIEPHNTLLLEIVALSSIAAISQAFDVIDFFFQARTQSRYTVMARTSVFVLASLARIVAVFLHVRLIAFAWIGALEILFSEIALAASYIRFRKPLPRWKWHLPIAQSFLRESWPLLVSGIMIMVYMRTDQILLGKLASKAVVGQYTVAIRLSEIWYSIPLVICASVMPQLLKSREASPARYYARLQCLYESMFLLGALVAVGTQFLGPLAVRLLFGREFAPAAGILSVHIWTGVFVFMGVVSGQQIVQEKISEFALYRTVAGAVVNIILNLLWIPRWGGMGSAMASLVAYSVAGYFADAVSPRTRHIFRMKTRAYLHFWMLYRLLFHQIQESAAEEV
jgi:PST family polysaccharide transporter